MRESDPDRGAGGTGTVATDRRRGAKGPDGQPARARAAASGGGRQAATRAMTVLHATEPATPYLSLFARIDSFTRADLDDALLESKSLVKQLAMRRTLFVFPRDLLPAAISSASARVARQEHDKLVKDLERSEVTADG